MGKLILVCLAIFTFLTLVTSESEAGQGCCSWHDGECGCSNGRTVCCDGSLSPSCTCYSPPVRNTVFNEPVGCLTIAQQNKITDYVKELETQIEQSGNLISKISDDLVLSKQEVDIQTNQKNLSIFLLIGLIGLHYLGEYRNWAKTLLNWIVGILVLGVIIWFAS